MEGVPHSVELQQRSACVLDLKRIPAVLSDCCMAHQITHTRNVANTEKKSEGKRARVFCLHLRRSRPEDRRAEIPTWLYRLGAAGRLSSFPFEKA